MTHSAFWVHSPIQRQNTNEKKLVIEKLFKNRLRRLQSLVKLIQIMNEK